MHKDFSLLTSRFQSLPEDFYSVVMPTVLNEPYWIACNESLLAEQGMANVSRDSLLVYLSGNSTNYSPPPLASVYSGHQFGVFAGQLGDGRALLIGDNIDKHHLRWEWQLKGAGLTPYSRFADGRAVLRSSIREYLCSEAMHGLHIPTTRALALTGSNDPVYREQVETSAVLTRIAPTFVRFGHFEHFYHRNQPQQVKLLADWVIKHHLPDCQQADNPYAALFAEIVRLNAELVAKWQSVGFCHGVLNTDNMSVLGLTIDYGPFAFMDGFQRDFICNTSDTSGRYRYQQQPAIVHWNLSALASTLQDLVKRSQLIHILNAFIAQYSEAYYHNMRAKLGLLTAQKEDHELIEQLLDLMDKQQVDFTQLFRRLSLLNVSENTDIDQRLLSLWSQPDDFMTWCTRYRQRLSNEHNEQAKATHVRATRMNSVNPKYILRNYLAQEEIMRAEKGDYGMITELHTCLQSPFAEQAQFKAFAKLPPDWAKTIRVSCSS